MKINLNELRELTSAIIKSFSYDNSICQLVQEFLKIIESQFGYTSSGYVIPENEIIEIVDETLYKLAASQIYLEMKKSNNPFRVKNIEDLNEELIPVLLKEMKAKGALTEKWRELWQIQGIRSRLIISLEQ